MLRGLVMGRVSFAILAVSTLLLSACVTTDMQGYADRQLPQQPIQRIAALVAAPPGLATSLQSSIAQEGKKRGILVEDAFLLLPPTRTYSDADIKSELARDGINAVLVLTVGDTGIQKEYAGTVFFGNSTTSLNGVGTATSFGGDKRFAEWRC